MKMKDLKPGMTVARRAPQWNLTDKPERLIVLSTKYFDGGTLWARTSDAMMTDFTVTADDTGEEYTVQTQTFTPRGDDRAKVLVLRVLPNGEYRTEYLTPGQIEGPYAEIRDRRAERRRKRYESDLVRREARRVEVQRLETVKDGLAQVGFAVDVQVSEYNTSTKVSMSLSTAEALLSRLQTDEVRHSLLSQMVFGAESED